MPRCCIAQTLLYLEEHGVRDYDQLAESAKAASDHFNEIAERQKLLEARLAEIAELKKHIINYSKTREIYAQYRKGGYQKSFFEEHREALTLHKAAKQAFTDLKVEKLQTIKQLNEEYERVLQEKKATYAEYRQARQEMKDLQLAKYNIERFLGLGDGQRQKEMHKNTDRAL